MIFIDEGLLDSKIHQWDWETQLEIAPLDWKTRLKIAPLDWKTRLKIALHIAQGNC